MDPSTCVHTVRQMCYSYLLTCDFRWCMVETGKKERETQADKEIYLIHDATVSMKQLRPVTAQRQKGVSGGRLSQYHEPRIPPQPARSPPALRRTRL